MNNWLILFLFTQNFNANINIRNNEQVKNIIKTVKIKYDKVCCFVINKKRYIAIITFVIVLLFLSILTIMQFKNIKKEKIKKAKAEEQRIANEAEAEKQRIAKAKVDADAKAKAEKQRIAGAEKQRKADEAAAKEVEEQRIAKVKAEEQKKANEAEAKAAEEQRIANEAEAEKQRIANAEAKAAAAKEAEEAEKQRIADAEAKAAAAKEAEESVARNVVIKEESDTIKAVTKAEVEERRIADAKIKAAAAKEAEEQRITKEAKEVEEQRIAKVKAEEQRIANAEAKAAAAKEAEEQRIAEIERIAKAEAERIADATRREVIRGKTIQRKKIKAEVEEQRIADAKVKEAAAKEATIRNEARNVMTQRIAAAKAEKQRIADAEAEIEEQRVNIEITKLTTDTPIQCSPHDIERNDNPSNSNDYQNFVKRVNSNASCKNSASEVEAPSQSTNTGVGETNSDDEIKQSKTKLTRALSFSQDVDSCVNSVFGSTENISDCEKPAPSNGMQKPVPSINRKKESSIAVSDNREQQLTSSIGASSKEDEARIIRMQSYKDNIEARKERRAEEQRRADAKELTSSIYRTSSKEDGSKLQASQQPIVQVSQPTKIDTDKNLDTVFGNQDGETNSNSKSGCENESATPSNGAQQPASSIYTTSRKESKSKLQVLREAREAKRLKKDSNNTSSDGMDTCETNSLKDIDISDSDGMSTCATNNSRKCSDSNVIRTNSIDTKKKDKPESVEEILKRMLGNDYNPNLSGHDNRSVSRTHSSPVYGNSNYHHTPSSKLDDNNSFVTPDRRGQGIGSVSRTHSSPVIGNFNSHYTPNRFGINNTPNSKSKVSDSSVSPSKARWNSSTNPNVL